MLRHIGALLYMKFKTLSKNKSLLFLNCQIKLEKNYMLICNVLHEYF